MCLLGRFILSILGVIKLLWLASSVYFSDSLRCEFECVGIALLRWWLVMGMLCDMLYLWICFGVWFGIIS